VAIVQSNYIPWRGYFDLMNQVDAFVLLDDVQYTRRDWRNRNRIKTADGLRWLSIPVQTKGSYDQRIDQTRIADPGWRRSHWSAIEQAYRRAPYFDEIAAVLAPLYDALDAELLSEVNLAFLECVRAQLGIDTPMSRSSEYRTAGERNRRLLDICHATGASEYVSGPLARDYLDVELFAREGVAVRWFDYSGYRPYAQLHGDFEPSVSIVDLLFCEGNASRDFLRSSARPPTDEDDDAAPDERFGDGGVDTTVTTGRQGARTRRAAATAAVAAAATLGIGGCGNDSAAGETPRATATSTAASRDGAAAAEAAPARVRTLRLQSQLAAPPRGAPTGSAPGSQLLFNGMLFKPGASRAIGRSQASCTRTASGAGEVFQCLLSFVLSGGMIYAQSTSSARGPADGVVTGGTRRYAYLRGTFRYKANGTPRVDLTFRLAR
jgi:hypothetical protein